MKAGKIIVIAFGLLAAACTVRSISNSGYPGEGPYARGSSNPLYQGELNEADLLVPDGGDITDAHIAAVLADTTPVTATLGKPLLVVQSGAVTPDSPMIEALASRFQVAPFSGVPPADRAAYAKRLRLAAAEGGCGSILVYWGELDAQASGEVTKVLSWVPIIGMAIPDETQRMRIKLKAAIIDVATGRWRMVMSPPVEDDSWSAHVNRAGADQNQVQKLKELGYARLAEIIVAQARSGT